MVLDPALIKGLLNQSRVSLTSFVSVSCNMDCL